MKPRNYHSFYAAGCCLRLAEESDYKLKQRLTKIWHGLGQGVINDAMDEWHKRLWACVRAKGGHFEHLM